MLIKSPYQDYYDSMQKLGIDRTLVYNRFPERAGPSLPVKYLRSCSIIGVCWRRFLTMFIDKKKHEERSYFIYDLNEMRRILKNTKYESREKLRELDQLIEICPNFHNFELGPIWVCGADGTRYNCALRPYDFHLQMDPYTIYQELQMWMGNQAEPRKPIPAVSNSDMIEAKGFDLKYSFRKEKSKKK